MPVLPVVLLLLVVLAGFLPAFSKHAVILPVLNLLLLMLILVVCVPSLVMRVSVYFSYMTLQTLTLMMTFPFVLHCLAPVRICLLAVVFLPMVLLVAPLLPLLRIVLFPRISPAPLFLAFLILAVRVQVQVLLASPLITL